MKKIILLLTLSVGIFLFNCKGNSKDNPVIIDDSQPMAPNAEFGEQVSLFEVLERRPEYNGFLKIVNMAKMFEELSALDNVTVFAPEDLDVNALLNDNLAGLTAGAHIEKMRNIINYHIVDGVITGSVLNASVMPDEKDVYRLKTRQGAYLSFVKKNGDIVISDELMNDIKILKLDVDATNGVVHNIGGTLIPQDDDSVNKDDNDKTKK